jgi:hypothetical protein
LQKSYLQVEALLQLDGSTQPPIVFMQFSDPPLLVKHLVVQVSAGASTPESEDLMFSSGSFFIG